MRHHWDIRGKRFGSLLVLHRAGRDNFGHIAWVTRCDCGRRHRVAGYLLTGNRAKRCWFCRQPQRGLLKKYKREYGSYGGMKARCSCPSDTSFKNYGGRGIKVCSRWLGPGGFVNFILDMGRRPEGKTLDRKNPEGNYQPDNCRWAGSKVQANNKRCSYTPEELAVLKTEAESLGCDSLETEML